MYQEQNKSLFSKITHFFFKTIMPIFFNILIISVIISKIAFWDISIVPSESMSPTLLNGDFVITSKAKTFRFDLSHLPFIGRWFLSEELIDSDELERGDIITIATKEKYFCKRIIGLPGDLIEFDNYDVEVNGESTIYINQKENNNTDTIEKQDMVPIYGAPHIYSIVHDNGEKEDLHIYKCRLKRNNKSDKYIEFNVLYTKKTADAKKKDRVKIYVPQGHIMAMGDNRNYSGDSRSYVFGFVKISQVMSTVNHVLFGSRAKFQTESTLIKKFGKNAVSYTRRQFLSWFQWFVEYPYQLLRKIMKINLRFYDLRTYHQELCQKMQNSAIDNNSQESKKIRIE